VPGEEQHAINRPKGSDREIGDQQQIAGVAGKFVGRDRGDGDVPLQQRAIDRGRDAAYNLDARQARSDSTLDRLSIEVVDRAECEPREKL
jgi:hypothetical protein